MLRVETRPFFLRLVFMVAQAIRKVVIVDCFPNQLCFGLAKQ